MQRSDGLRLTWDVADLHQRKQREEELVTNGSWTDVLARSG